MWINPKTLEVALNNMQVRELRPNWSAPLVPTDDMVMSQGFVPMKEVAPIFDPLAQRAVAAPPKLIDGVWTQQWKIEGLAREQVQAGLVAAIQAKIAEIDAARLRANFGTFTYMDQVFSCDALSRSDLDATAGYVGLFGAFSPDFPNAWKKADGTYILMPTVAEFKAFYQAFYDQGLVNLRRSESLKQRLASATTTAEIAAIQWDNA